MVKKTGAIIPDKLSVTRENNYSSSTNFVIHFPNLTTDPNSVGVTVTLDSDTFKELAEKIKSLIARSCPRCGRGVSFTRSRELDNGYYYCEYCGWSEE